MKEPHPYETEELVQQIREVQRDVRLYLACQEMGWAIDELDPEKMEQLQKIYKLKKLVGINAFPPPT